MTPEEEHEVNLRLAKAYEAGKDWMRQGRDYVEGWRDGAKAAFDHLGIRKDERMMTLIRSEKAPKYSWERAEPKKDVGAPTSNVTQSNERK